MRDLLEFIAKGITAKPEMVSVNESRENDLFAFKISVSEEDFGTIIGKGGRTIKSLRDLLRLRAQKEGIRYSLEIDEPNKNPSSV